MKQQIFVEKSPDMLMSARDGKNMPCKDHCPVVKALPILLCRFPEEKGWPWCRDERAVHPH